MKAFFHPESVCIIGASAEAQRIGGRPVHYLNRAGFEGRLYPVNPNRTEIQGHKAYPTVSDLPECPRLALIALPRDHVLPALRECVAKGVPAVSIFSSGFAEMDDAGRALQAAMGEAIRGTGTRVLGPNTNGTMAPGHRLYACFTPLLQRGLPVPGGVAILTQSAALGTYLLDQCRERGIGVAYWAHTGNEADLDLLDACAFAVEDPEVRTLLITSEVLRAPQRLRAMLARAAERGVLVAVLQVGRSELGEIAAASHTGALVGLQSKVTRGLLSHGGAVLAQSMRELVDIAEAHERFGRVPGARIGVLTPSGGFGIMLADALEGTGVSLPRFSPALQERLLAAAPFCHPGNPVDITAQIMNEPQRFEPALTAMADSGELDILLTFLPVGSDRDPLTQQLVAVAERYRRTHPAVRFGVVGTVDRSAFAALQAAGVARWAEPDDLRSAMAAIAGAAPAVLPALPLPAEPSAALAALVARSAAAGIVGEADSKALLRQRGLKVVQDAHASSPAAAAAAADDIGYPVALKLQAPGLAHKAAAGGVRLGLASHAEVVRAAQAMLDTPAAAHGATLLVEPMLSGIELFVSASESPQYGPLCLFGLGGGQVERQARVAYRYLPLAASDPAGMLEELGLQALLEASAADADLPRQVHAIVGVLQDLLVEGGGLLRAIELNPVMVDARGNCTIVDALIEAGDPAAETEREGTP
jgi:acyl-CoA synthetase (NDP forming)